MLSHPQTSDIKDILKIDIYVLMLSHESLTRELQFFKAQIHQDVHEGDCSIKMGLFDLL